LGAAAVGEHVIVVAAERRLTVADQQDGGHVSA
jgi:hypothetical protein